MISKGEFQLAAEEVQIRTPAGAPMPTLDISWKIDGGKFAYIGKLASYVELPTSTFDLLAEKLINGKPFRMRLLGCTVDKTDNQSLHISRIIYWRPAARDQETTVWTYTLDRD